MPEMTVAQRIANEAGRAYLRGMETWELKDYAENGYSKGAQYLTEEMRNDGVSGFIVANDLRNEIRGRPSETFEGSVNDFFLQE